MLNLVHQNLLLYTISNNDFSTLKSVFSYFSVANMYTELMNNRGKNLPRGRPDDRLFGKVQQLIL